MTDMLPITAWWPRHSVREVEAPDAGLLNGASRAWLWLDGSHSSTLQDDVFAITHRFDALWVWRHTDWEYAGPGYRAGPMLVPLSEPLLEHFLANWAVPQTGMSALPLPLGRTLDEALAETDARSGAMGSSTESDLSPEAVTGVISLLLYLCSEKPDLGRDVLVPVKPEPVKTKKGLRWFPPDRVTTWDVGMRLGSTLRHAYAQADAKEDGGGTHGSPRPHIRRAHWHTFLTGPRTDPLRVLRWLPPIAVNVENVGDLVPTVHPVKG